jgi:sedoheptulokinase
MTFSVPKDFVVAMLCDLDVPVMSVQNSASWGYFNTIKKEWNTDILQEAGFPVGILPKTVMGGDPAGKLPSSTWHVVPEGTPGIKQYYAVNLIGYQRKEHID